MHHRDLNLLVALDVLLEEGSVAAAARRMNLSPPAMSRTLSRIRVAFDDPIFVQAGRRMTPTPRALELQQQVHAVVAQATGLFRNDAHLDLSRISPVFTIQADDLFLGALGAALLERLRNECPGVTLRFISHDRHDDVSLSLRERHADLFIGAPLPFKPEIRTQSLFTTGFRGFARKAHPIFQQPVTLERFVQFDQISISRQERYSGAIDEMLATRGLTRRLVLIVPTFFTMIETLRGYDLIMLMPDIVIETLPHREIGLRAFELPFHTPPLTGLQAWHPRNDKDALHRWLRRTVRELCLKMKNGHPVSDAPDALNE
ncbi:LysR family transcriptional regulator [Novacetimonas hansenii]|uniref:LysR family transcriptional regulator n=1 Tax=Novacetimonas hansenii TaxID=436 RepID=UPI00094FDD98|nr:LysR family transcriptional regulator [Novacetimonas hansenii]